MKSPLYPTSDIERIKALRELLIIDSLPERRFEAVTAYAKARFKVDLALIHLVEESPEGPALAESASWRYRSGGTRICGFVMRHGEVVVVENTLLDWRFSNNPMVIGAPLIRFYAGAPLRFSCGRIVGTLCLIATKPRYPAQEEIEHFEILANMIAHELEEIEIKGSGYRASLQGIFPANHLLAI